MNTVDATRPPIAAITINNSFERWASGSNSSSPSAMDDDSTRHSLSRWTLSTCSMQYFNSVHSLLTTRSKYISPESFRDGVQSKFIEWRAAPMLLTVICDALAADLVLPGVEPSRINSKPRGAHVFGSTRSVSWRHFRAKFFGMCLASLATSLSESFT